jgi:hypothetical protein
MRTLFAVSAAAVISIACAVPALAQTVNVTPNQQTTQATAVSNPTGQNISQQNNFSDPGVNAFGPGVQCSGPYLASNAYRNDSSTPGQFGGFTNTGGTVGLVVPLNGSNKKCQEFVHEILFQKQLDTCLSLAKQGFEFDPNGQYAELAKRCSGIRYTGHPINSAAPVSPAPPPTVITVPAGPPQPSSVLPVPTVPLPHAAADAPALPAELQVGIVPAPAARERNDRSYCQPMAPARKKRLIATVRKHDANRRTALDALHAACVPDADILAAL